MIYDLSSLTHSSGSGLSSDSSDPEEEDDLYDLDDAVNRDAAADFVHWGGQDEADDRDAAADFAHWGGIEYEHHGQYAKRENGRIDARRSCCLAPKNVRAQGRFGLHQTVSNKKNDYRIHFL